MKVKILFLSLLFLLANFIFLPNNISGESVLVDYPSNVNVGQIFNINLTLIDFESTSYDIKIDINNASGRISEIYNGSVWKSTNLYVNGALNTSIINNSVFLLNITKNYNGTANITVSIRRNSSSTVDSFGGYLINVTFISLPPACTSSYFCGSWTTCSNNNQTRICTNTTANCTTTTYNVTETQSCSTNSSIYLELNWTNSEIINSDEFDIEVKAFNLLDYDYDIKIWLEFKDNNTVISDRYDENEKEWKSGTYFVAGFFSGSGNDSEDITIRLREDYKNFSGEAKILARLREGDDTIKDINYTINILKKAETDNDDSLILAVSSTDNTNISDKENEVIKLGSKNIKETNETEDIKTEKSTIYKSKNEYIKEYAIYGFAILCVFLIILLLIDRK